MGLNAMLLRTIVESLERSGMIFILPGIEYIDKLKRYFKTLQVLSVFLPKFPVFENAF